MQDKDMDALFRSKLEGFEAEPSAGVWSNINQELHGHRKSLAPLLGIAASVMIMVTAGLIFMIKDKKPAPIKSDHKMAHVQPVKMQVIGQTATTTRPAMAVTGQQQVSIKRQQQLAVIHHHYAIPVAQIPIAKINTVKPAAVTVKQEVIAPNQQILAAVADTKINLNRPVVSDTQISPALTDTIPEFIAKSAAVSVTNTSDNNKPATAKKHKLRGLGGVLNAMIGTVDKRQDKIIEFTDTDEGDSVTGINLGIIKIKKQ